MVALTWRGVLAWRLRRQHLDRVGATSVADVVRTLGAVAAQLDPAWAELGIRTRCATSEVGDVGRAVADGLVLKTFAFRGAVHLMTPDLAGVHLALRASSRMWERPGWQSHYGLAPADWPGLRAAVREALSDGPLTRAELAAAVATLPRYAHLTPAITDPAATLLKPFAWQGDLSLGSSRDGHLTLQALDVPGWDGLPDVDHAGPRAVEAYLAGYGPASVANLEYWLAEGLGVRRAAIRAWVTGLGDRVSTVEVEGEPRLVLRDDLDDLVSARPSPVVRLLPRYDQWVLGPGTADVHVVPASLRPEVSRGANVVVVGGAVAGTWSLAGDEVVVSWAPGAPEPAVAQFEAEVDRLAVLVDRPLRPT